MLTEQMIAACEEEYAGIQDKLIDMIKEIRIKLEDLDEIALKPNPSSSFECVLIDLLMRYEEKEADQGCQERVQLLSEVIQQAERAESADNTETLTESTPFSKFLRNLFGPK